MTHSSPIHKKDTGRASFAPRSVATQKAQRFRMRSVIMGVCIGAGSVVATLLCIGAVVYLGYWKPIAPASAAPLIAIEDPRTHELTELAYGPIPLLSQPDFFKEVEHTFIESKTTFLEANLSEMRIRLYEDGILKIEVPILTKGKEGSWWETPAGLYKIQTKEENHFSSFGEVYQPWSMAFQGNFFIHGWPYYPDGTPVASAYSGGCIRLSDTDAQMLFGLVTVDMPVLVYEADYGSDGFVYSISAPGVTAKEYAVFDIESGMILSGKDMAVVRPIASVTKLTTALVAAEYINLDKDIVIPETARASTSVPRLTPGESISAYSLLLPLLLESSNEAAEALASKVGRARFITLMNEKVAALGMKDTHFTDPAGSEHANVSTVSDLLRLAQYLYNNRSFVLRISSGHEVPTAYRVDAFPNLQNFNEIPGIKGFLGGKIGTNSIGQMGLFLYKVRVGESDRTIAIVLLDSQDRNGDVAALLRHLERTYGATLSTI